MATRAAPIIGATAIAVLAFCAPSSASVESDRASLTLDVRGRIASSCSIDLQSRADVGELSQAGAATVPISIDCNHPLRYALRSQNGGMQHLVQAEYVVPYTARLELDGRSGRALRSQDIRAEAGVDDLGCDPPFEQDGRLVIRWDAPRRELVQGQYRDVLTITVVMEGQ